MKKGNLAFLLLFPFVISFLGVTTIVGTFSRIAKDLIDIEWDYGSESAMVLTGSPTILTARQIYDKSATLAVDNDLIYEIANFDPNDEEEHARLEKSAKPDARGNYEYRIYPLSEGTIVLSVSNKKKTITKRTKLFIYPADSGVIIVTPVIEESGAKNDVYSYIGEYDVDASFTKRKATKQYKISVFPSSDASSLHAVGSSSNIDFDFDTKTMTVRKASAAVEDAYFRLKSEHVERQYDFKLVKDGINVYDYDTLLNCTNKSKEGEIVCQQVGFESLSRYAKTGSDGYAAFDDNGNLQPKANNVALFGHFQEYAKYGAVKTPKFSFKDEVYPFKTSGSTQYIDEWNAFAAETRGYTKSIIDPTLYAGLRIQKDYYGNGYALNLHNLAYPYTYAGGMPTLTSDNVFRGPLYAYCLGDPVHFPVVALYGQDNVGMYVDGDGIKIHDVRLRNCDYDDSFSFLKTTGTVLEFHGSNNSVTSSVLQNGKNVVRAFEGKGNLIENCQLAEAQNFLLDVGSYQSKRMDINKMHRLRDVHNSTRTEMLATFLTEEGRGNTLLNTYLGFGSLLDRIGIPSDMVGIPSNVKVQDTLEPVRALASAMADETLASDYKTTITVRDCVFYKTGISSIGLESAFNGPYMSMACPNLVNMLFSVLGNSVIPFIPTGYRDMSYPARVNVEGDCAFYDYKAIDDMVFDGLLQQDLLNFFLTIGGEEAAKFLEERNIDINLEAIFPIKDVIKTLLGTGYTKKGQACPIASYFGGGANYSIVDTTKWNERPHYSGAKDADLVGYYTGLKANGNVQALFNSLYRTVTLFTGFHPFKFSFYSDGYHYGDKPAALKNIDRRISL